MENFKSTKFCALSPVVKKTWNKLITLNGKSPFVKRQLENMSNQNVPSDNIQSCNYEDTTNERYATVRKLNEIKQSTVKKTKDYVRPQLKQNLNRLYELKTEMVSIQSEIKKQNSNYENILNDFFDDDMVKIKINLVKSLEQELTEFESRHLSKQISSASMLSHDSGVSSYYGDEEEYFYKTTNLETLV
ncbi:unnamed protein product [Brachionus calyciflorus]|uniref:Uncharacterized protein n=1 Tax=Brachionus calyciflorus TaxID=104777 RepID=A0A813R0T4_9BILA|nr:unnamed protein product [Brachionus calyciflorus]